MVLGAVCVSMFSVLLFKNCTIFAARMQTVAPTEMRSRVKVQELSVPFLPHIPIHSSAFYLFIQFVPLDTFTYSVGWLHQHDPAIRPSLIHAFCRGALKMSHTVFLLDRPRCHCWRMCCLFHLSTTKNCWNVVSFRFITSEWTPCVT